MGADFRAFFMYTVYILEHARLHADSSYALLQHESLLNGFGSFHLQTSCQSKKCLYLDSEAPPHPSGPV